MKRFVIAAALVAVGAASAFAGPIEDRQALMKAMAKNTKELAAVAKGETPFDAAKVKALLQVYVDDSAKLPTLFPDDSKTGGTDPTTAAPKIWEDQAGFKTAAAKLGTDATAALGAADQASFAKAFGTVASNCTSCHGTYRIKKN
ncbi:cytochrome C556 [Labrys sp. KNU-23]|uniref:c-type cytochrome n=1 Tax=Labrys sp. KNU-23 TaxID=2789216 RepID=UPI0011EFA334|nr:cytochrome c [Labrys sp. KNU-23]QEN89426.1 cytochrome C556 [Labrys sp. KNU-23]